MFLYQAVGDTMCPVYAVDKVVNKYCAAGVNILYHRNSLGGHNDEGTTGRQRALDWLGDVLDGSHVTAMPAKGLQHRQRDRRLQRLCALPLAFSVFGSGVLFGKDGHR